MPFSGAKETGMGLGLPIAQRIMRHHKGALKLLKSHEGGSAFAFSIPRGKPTEPEDES